MRKQPRNKKQDCAKPRKKYRGRGKKTQRKLDEFSVMLVNLRGFRSKRQSLKKIISIEKPSMVAINESQLTGRMKVSLKPMVCWSRNRVNKGGGGVATAVSPVYKDSTIGAGESEGENEYIITRVASFSPALNVINYYGEQRKTSKENVEKNWRMLIKDMNKIRARQEFCLFLGDMNKLIGCGQWGVPGNHSEVTVGGRLLLELLATKDWVLVNALGEDMVKGGPFTRKDPASGKLSCLDLFVVSKDLRPYVKELIVDSERQMAPFRIINSGNQSKPS